MIDLHSHILPGIDDGAPNLEAAVEMARIAVESGVKIVVATPHCAQDRTDEVYSTWKLLQSALLELDIPLKIGLGMEILGTRRTVQLLRDNRMFTINQSRYPLVEFRFHSDGLEETTVIRDLLRYGYRPIVAHPERYSFIQNDPGIINEWFHMGCLFQINRGSLLGRFGAVSQRCSAQLVGRGFATIVASDAHSPVIRTPWLDDVRELLAEEYSPETAEDLLLRNPSRILQNQEINPATPDWF